MARRYGFVEIDGPVLESVELYKKKSGGELVGQLFDFTDKGEREVALRPEMTPTLARMVAARDREFKKPLKWFSIASFFRYEKAAEGPVARVRPAQLRPHRRGVPGRRRGNDRPGHRPDARLRIDAG